MSSHICSQCPLAISLHFSIDFHLTAIHCLLKFISIIEKVEIFGRIKNWASLPLDILLSRRVIGAELGHSAHQVYTIIQSLLIYLPIFDTICSSCYENEINETEFVVNEYVKVYHVYIRNSLNLR